MSTYESLKGLKVKYLSADTSGDRLQEGEIFYNSTDFGLKSHIAVGAWSAGTPIPATKYLPVPKAPPADHTAVAICDLRPKSVEL